MLHPVLGLAHALAALAERRDPVAWALLVERAGPEMASIAQRLAGDVALADDAVQEALIHIRDGADGFVSRSEDPDNDARRWIMRVTANAALQLLRRKRRSANQDRLGGEGHFPTPDAPGVALERAEQASLVRRELAELPEPTRAAIVLHCVDGLGYDQIAIELRIPVGTAKTRVHRGLETLRGRLLRVGCALSLVALTGVLQNLHAATASMATTAWISLLTSTKASTVDAISIRGLSMSVKIAIGLAAVLAVATIPVVLSQDVGRPTIPTTAAPVLQRQSEDQQLKMLREQDVKHEDEARVSVARKLEQKISVEFQGQSIAEVAKQLRLLCGLDIVVDPVGIRKNDGVTIQVSGMKTKDLLDNINLMNNVAWHNRYGAVLLSSSADMPVVVRVDSTVKDQLDQLVTIEFIDQPLPEVVRRLQGFAKVPITLGRQDNNSADTEPQQVSLRVTNMRLKHALAYVAKLTRRTVMAKGGEIVFSAAAPADQPPTPVQSAPTPEMSDKWKEVREKLKKRNLRPEQK